VAELATQVADAHTVVAAVYTRWPAVVAVASTAAVAAVASTAVAVASVVADTAVVVVDTGKRTLAEERFKGNGWRLCQPFFLLFVSCLHSKEVKGTADPYSPPIRSVI
jgi:hypothetical protein